MNKKDIIALLVKVARTAHDVSDGCEQRNKDDYRPDGDDMRAMFDALFELDKIPEPLTHLSSPGGKAEYWLNQRENEQQEGQQSIGGDFYNGIEWLACWLLDNVEGETITEEELRPWAVSALKAAPKQEAVSDGGLLDAEDVRKCLCGSTDILIEHYVADSERGEQEVNTFHCKKCGYGYSE